MAIQAGKLRHRVAFQRVALAQNDYGEPVETWATVPCYGRVPVEVLTRGGNEKLFSARNQATATHLIRTRYMRGLNPTPKDRIKWGDRVLNIEHVDDVNSERVEHNFYCTEVTDG